MSTVTAGLATRVVMFACCACSMDLLSVLLLSTPGLDNNSTLLSDVCGSHASGLKKDWGGRGGEGPQTSRFSNLKALFTAYLGSVSDPPPRLPSRPTAPMKDPKTAGVCWPQECPDLARDNPCFYRHHYDEKMVDTPLESGPTAGFWDWMAVDWRHCFPHFPSAHGSGFHTNHTIALFGRSPASDLPFFAGKSCHEFWVVRFWAMIKGGRRATQPDVWSPLVGIGAGISQLMLLSRCCQTLLLVKFDIAIWAAPKKPYWPL